jgi:predicted transcriptional regulator of viral defense system
MGSIVPHNGTERTMKTSDFLALHNVFSLDEAAQALAPAGGKAGTVERLKHHLAAGRLKLVTREIYAVVPQGVEAQKFQPDPFLVGAAIRPEGVFSHHSALELLGAAHSVWNQCTLYVPNRRRALSLTGMMISFLEQPKAMRITGAEGFATRKVERQGKLLPVTGPERTLVEGFSRPGLAGGLEELVVSASGFPTLDLHLLKDVLKRYGVAKLWASAGWFLERFQSAFHVSDSYLLELEKFRPVSPQYLLRDRRGGTLSPRWSLILPPDMEHLGGPDER